MKKALKYMALVFFGFLWFLGCSPKTTKYLFDEGYLKDDFQYGDLYRLSNLPQFKEPLSECKVIYTGEKSDVHLYLAGDSFTDEGRVSGEEFSGASYQRIFVANPNDSLVLKEGQRILVIETVERHFRERFSEQVWNNWQLYQKRISPPEKKDFYQVFLNFKIPYKEEMHESTLFSFSWALWFKELKASMNYHLFDKVDPKVALVNNTLVYDLDVESGISSIYDSVEDEEIQRIVKNANVTRENYLKLGFDEVYLSVIPNKSSLVENNNPRYNRLIERVENHPDLKIPVISVWKEFTAKNYYQKGDSHWNCEGQQIWVDKVNQQLNVNK